jgi:hypothetical protein
MSKSQAKMPNLSNDPKILPAFEKHECCFCGADFGRWGHNPAPLMDGTTNACCDKCNFTKVIPARLAEMEITLNWEEVYNDSEPFNKYCPPNLSYLKDGVYYQTYGGGPEGGYVETPNSDVYEVERGWGTPFTARKCEGKKLVYRKCDEMKGIPSAVRLR